MSSSTIHHRRHRGGFTLTELLIVITIIGLLVGLLAVAGGTAITSTREFAVNTEITQISQSIENFKTKYGFYPPSFEQFKRTVNTGDTTDLGIIAAEANQLLPFLNKIAPNHQELAPSPTGVAGRTRLMDWWENVGCNLDQSTSLQFWLSGLCHNKQFPLTGGLIPPVAGGPYMPVGYNVEVFVDGTEIVGGLEREVFYDFDTERFVPVDIDNGGTPTRPVVQYIMDYGKTNGDLFFVYRDADSYWPVAQPGTAPDNLDPNARMATTTAATPSPGFASPLYPAYIASENHRGLAYHFLWDTAGPTPLRPTFANPNTFQLITFGLDGDAGVMDPDTGTFIPNENRGNILAQGPKSKDNLANFAQGRLDKYIDDQQQ